MITPERPLRAVTGMITGLHEPRATHLAMVRQVIAAAGGNDPAVATRIRLSCSAGGAIFVARVRRFTPDHRGVTDTGSRFACGCTGVSVKPRDHLMASNIMIWTFRMSHASVL